MTVNSVMAPLGISFLTFSAISYLVDVKRGEDAGTFLDAALYLTFFPKVISGPIILWKDFRDIHRNSILSVPLFVSGLNRIMIGFIKKLIFADVFGAVIYTDPSIADPIYAWAVVILYMLQIYFDFSAYSDIAIGISRTLGFSFQENFHFPYQSTSISEFWRRWHISLGSWFQQYIYFPLGGSRGEKRKTIRNIAIVFLLTGIWHGAGGNYLLWGGINGFFVILERLLSKNTVYQRVPRVIKWLLTMNIVMFSWMFFCFPNLEAIQNWIQIMFGLVKNEDLYYTWQYYLDNQVLILAGIAMVLPLVINASSVQRLKSRIQQNTVSYLIQEGVLLLLFVVAILFMVNATYHPFIYFQY